MARSIKGITIEIEGKTSGLVKSLNDANKAIKDTEAHLRTINKALKLDPGNVDLIKSKQNALATEIAETKKKLEAEKKAAEDAAEALKKGAITQGEYDALQADIALTTDKLKELEKEAKSTSSVLGQQMQAAGDKISSVGDKISSVGESLLPMTAAVGGVAAASLSAFNEVDSAYDTLITKTGAAGEALEGMKSIVDDIATTMPTSFDSAASAVGEVNTRFGLTGDALKDLSEQFLKFANINGVDVSNAVDSVQKGLAAFGLNAESAGEYLDTLNAVGQRTGLDVGKLSDSLVTVAPQLNELGLSATQAAQFLGDVELSGADVSAVMTGLRAALKNATSEGKSMDEALADMQDALANSKDDAEGLQMAYELFGSKAGASIYSAIKKGSLSFEELGKTATDSLGSVSDTYEGTIDGIDKTTTALNALKLAGAEVGAAIGETLAPILSAVAEKLKVFAEKWSEMSPEMQNVVVIIGGLVAALGPVLIIIGKVVTAVGAITSFIGTLMPIISGIAATIGGLISTALLPILPVIAAIAAAIAAVIVVIKNWDAIVELAGVAFEGLKSVLTTAATAIKNGLINAFKAIGSTVKGVFDNLKTWAADVKSKLVSAFDSMRQGISEKVNTIKDNITHGFNSAVTFLKDLPKNALTWGRDLIANFIQGIKDRISSLSETLKGAAQKVKDFLGFSEPKEGPLSNFHTYAPDMMDLFAKGITDNTDTVTNALQRSTGAMSDTVKSDYSGVLNQIAANTGTSAAMAGQSTGDININLKVGNSQFGRAVVKAGQINSYRSGGH